MPIPEYQALMLPVLKLVAEGRELSIAQVLESLALEFKLTETERAELLPSGRQKRFDNRVHWAFYSLKRAGALESPTRARYVITDRGRDLLSSNPARIDEKLLQERFPERYPRAGAKGSAAEEDAVFDEAAQAWVSRPGIEEKVHNKIELAIPDERVRSGALQLLAFAIENADEERSDGWWLRDTTHGLKLMAARLLACKIGAPYVQVAVIGPVDDDVRGAIGADPDDDDEFKMIPGGVLLKFPVEHAAEALPLLRDGLNGFIDLAMSRIRRKVSLESHVPEAVDYVSSALARELPQPVPHAESDDTDDDDEGDDVPVSREPRIRGRAPIFEPGQRSIASLISDIDREVLALPDLQRPFVWEDTKVRDLLDSLFIGFPVGTLVLWHTTDEKDARAMGDARAGLKATTLVIDGQQRLTSLAAVIGGRSLIDKDESRRDIQIAFRPRDGRFEVADAAIRNDPEFLPNVTELWRGPRPTPQIRRDLLKGLRDKGRTVDDQYEDAVERNLDRARTIGDYRIPTVDIRKTAADAASDVTEEDVAEIFVRINNQGKRLGQADFVLTLLSVFHGDLRDRIETRAREMSQAAVVSIDTQQLLRAACAVAFRRARMSAVYRSLRGIDPVTGEADPAGRARRLAELDAAADDCVDGTVWRDYLLRVKHAGFVSPGLIASKNAIVNAYAFYIQGRNSGVPRVNLDQLVSRWVFATLMTARYSGSSETVFEEDLARVGRVAPMDAAGFVAALDTAMTETITGDYWTRTLVAALETQKGRAPSALAFRAAQVVLGARALFSDQAVQNLVDPPADAGRAASEVHHLFPEAWLRSRGVSERRRINQVANLAIVGWYENNVIGGRSPAAYVPRVRQMLSIDDDRWGRMCAEHALPLGWESMDYEDFLHERRRRMADVIRAAFRRLGGEADADPVRPPWFLPGTEDVWRKIAETELALRRLVRNVYVSVHAQGAATKVVASLGDAEQESLARALRALPTGADPLSVIDYLYLGQLPRLLFAVDVWPHVKNLFPDDRDLRQRLQTALSQIAPVRNEIAHVREVEPDRLMRANLACGDVLAMIASAKAGT